MASAQRVLDYITTAHGGSPRAALERLARNTAVLARSNPNVFVPFVLRDEESHKAIRQMPFHAEWHRLALTHKHLVILASVESGKTVQMSIGHVLWALGCDTSLRVVVLSSTQGLATKIVSAVRRYISESADLRIVFPDLRPGTPWTGDAINVQRKTFSKDHSFQACGLYGNILGARIDLLIIDDALNWDNCRTEYQRAKALSWIESDLLSRLTGRSRIIAIGNPYHPRDALALLSQRPGWHGVRYPIIGPDGLTRWPARWPQERIEEWRTNRHPDEFARQLLCVARDAATMRCKREWIDLCLQQGEAIAWAPRLPASIPRGAYALTGVDLGIGKKTSSALTVFTTILVFPGGRKQILCIESGRWSGPDIIAKAREHHDRYLSTIYVESNAAQDFLVQFAAQDAHLPVRPFLTDASKHHPDFGIEAVFAEFANGKWVFPSRGGIAPELQALIDACVYYTPEEHTADHLMSVWIAREASRRFAAHGPRVVHTDVNIR